MQTFKAGAPTSVTIPFVDANDRSLIPTGLTYRIVDENGEDILEQVAIDSFDADKGEVAIQITAEQNGVTAGQFGGYRRIDLWITTASGLFLQTAEYLLQVGAALTILGNSFQTYEQALVLAMQLGQLDGWSAATDELRKSTLARAYDNLCSFSYVMFAPSEDRAGENDMFFGSMRDVTAEEFATLLPNQQADFRKAQIVEADYLLGGNPIEKMIADGEQSSTIGEVSKFFRPRASLVLPISRAARSYVGRYISWSRVVGRA